LDAADVVISIDSEEIADVVALIRAAPPRNLKICELLTAPNRH
jgi:hypothetical protein